MAVTYKIVLEGRILPEAEIEQVLVKASKLLHLNTEKVESLLQGKPRTIKQNLDRQKAQKYVQAISAAGMACHMAPCEPTKENKVEEASKPKNKKIATEKPKSTSRCVQCGHPFDLDAETDQFEKCPLCGFILNQPEKSLDTKSTVKNESSTSPNIPEIKDAPKSSRISAALGSFLISGLFIGICYLAIATVIFKMNGDFLSSTLPDEIWVNAKLSYIHETIILYASVIGLFILISYFIIIPSLKGGTWTQRLLNIEVIRMDTKESMYPMKWIIRAMSQCIHLLPFVLPLVVFTFIKGQLSNLELMLSFIIGMFLNLPFLARKNPRSIPDILSGTRQIIRTNIISDRKATLWAIVAICLIGCFSGVAFGRFLITPPNTTIHKKDHIAIQSKKGSHKICKAPSGDER